MPKGTSGTCHYCPCKATHNVVWLKDKRGQPSRIVLPHCGCDLMEALQRFWPSPYQIHEGTDYVLEPFPGPTIQASGDGTTVTFAFRRGSDIVVAESDNVVYVRVPKALARKLSDEVREASHAPGPGCNDADAHRHDREGCVG